MDKQSQLSSLISDYIGKLVVGYAKMNDLSASQLYILKLLGTEGDKNCSEIAKKLDISLSAVTNLVNKLAKKRYVDRTIPAHNRRMVMLQITEKGMEKLNESDSKFMEVTNQLITDLSDEELDMLIRVYEKFHVNYQIND
ncbi:MarR family transcriptional regulator [Shimazuella kribbensis]|uniref:MarR family transcriptional regulator n=1 Tax=Shimazuella kribbensis TaxID=139808 RepID=UPI00041577A8|nr:MarR family transcriptional regulator [Shimazuella kribbensis]